MSKKSELACLIASITLPLLLITTSASANLNVAKRSYSIVIDADFSNAVASAKSIELGVHSALGEVDYQVNGVKLNVVTLNHHGSTRRSLKNIKTFQSDPDGLVLVGGMHSPPLLANKNYINRHQLLTLVPWAAAGPITRPDRGPNWIFRLSIDDSKAGYVISRSAVEEGFSQPFLLLEKTGWGHSNLRTMSESLNALSISVKGGQRFNWGIGINNAKIMLRRAKASGADVIFFVGNSSEGKVFADAMMALPESLRLPIRSHWGITGGDFANHIASSLKQSYNLQFIQTRFSFLQKEKNMLQQQVLDAVIRDNKDIVRAQDIVAQTGFIHAYDATKILLTAMTNMMISGDKKVDRIRLKEALENIKQPVHGLLKTYQTPFTAYSPEHMDAHEALTMEDYVMGYYNKDNNVILLDDNH